MNRQIGLWLDDRRHELGNGCAASPDPEIDGVQSGIFHRRFQIIERGPVIPAIDHDRNCEIRRTGGILVEPTQAPLRSINCEEKSASSAAVGKILCDAGMKSSGGGVWNR